MVSISLITYNHEKYVRQALDNILNQERDFDIEIIVGDDCSPDNTRSIILEYQEKHPDLIQTIFHKEKPKGIPGKINFVSTIHAATGKYVAMLDGDDYWTDPRKLQKQVDFLESHPDYSLCFHNARLVFEGVDGKDRNYHPETRPATYTIEDLVGVYWFIHSGSIMYRREWFPKVRDSFYALPSGDIPVCISLSARGPVGYLPDVMSVYRKNAASISHSNGYVFEKALQTKIQIYETLNEDLDHQFEPVFRRVIDQHQLHIAKYALRGNNNSLFRETISSISKQATASFTSREKLLYRFLKLMKMIPPLQKAVPVLLKLRARVDPAYQYN